MGLFANPVPSSPFAAAQPLDAGSTGSSSTNASSDSNSATITGNDFLKLLVTEMQNQDPTATTDPNEYIDQLVQVNSLEQLISINQDLGGISSSSGGTGSSGTNGQVASAGTAPASAAAASGNLSATDTGGRASRIASALGAAAHTLAPGAARSPMQSAINSLKTRAHAAHANVSNPAH
jgi:flagellar basal-body rod modification protein FlgD